MIEAGDAEGGDDLDEQQRSLRGLVMHMVVHVTSARGDCRPCTHTACSGTMQFGRKPLPETASSSDVEGERGWVCSESRGHFQRA
jgi:hypothetical protein